MEKCRNINKTLITKSCSCLGQYREREKKLVRDISKKGAKKNGFVMKLNSLKYISENTKIKCVYIKKNERNNQVMNEWTKRPNLKCVKNIEVRSQMNICNEFRVSGHFQARAIPFTCTTFECCEQKKKKIRMRKTCTATKQE